MGNFKNYNFNKYDLKLSNQDYYDFHLNTDNNCFNCTQTPNPVAYFDFNNKLIFTPQNGVNSIHSLTTWNGAINNGINIKTYGLTGLDNGVLNYTKDSINDPNNLNLTDVLLNSDLIISNDIRFFLTKVNGHARELTYDINLIESNNPHGAYMEFKGGFYQGYYKLDGFDYQTLPNRFKNGFTVETWLNKDDSIMISHSGTTMNDLNPNNKGFFLYFGTRSENKFWNQFSGNTLNNCTNSTNNFCTEIKEDDVFLTLENGFTVPLNPPVIEFKTITNEFLIYGRAGRGRCNTNQLNDGLGIYTPCDFSGSTSPSITVSGYTENYQLNETNPFLIYGRARGRRCDSGKPYDGFGTETVFSLNDKKLPPPIELDIKKDVTDNALGFRIKDDGSIGYRLLTVTKSCIDKIYSEEVTVVEEYSAPNLITEKQWTNVIIRWKPSVEISDCDLLITKPRTGKLMIYINCQLKHVFNEFPEFIGRRLDELKEKQVGVPFNISLGGGSQGLKESITFDGQDQKDLNLFIESNFSGTFIGGISQFKLYDNNLNWCQIKNHCSNNLDRYGDQNCYLLDEDNNPIIQEDGFKIIVNC